MAAPRLPAPVQPSKRGYQRLAAVMAWDPGMAMIPRFRAANFLNLLCLQAEIRDLEEKLEVQTRTNDQLLGDEKLYSCDFDILKDHGKHSTQWRLVLELRSKLEEYNRAVVHQIAMNDQCSPCRYDYELLQDWLNSPKGGARDLRGAGAVGFLKPEHGGCTAENFLMLSKKNGRSDQFRRACNTAFTFLLRMFPDLEIKHQTFLPEENTAAYRLYGTAESLGKFGDRFATMLASILILIPVVILHFVTNPNNRLALIVVFTLVFTASMALFAGAKRSEIFAAAAAFVAVQVVYVGSVT